MQPSDFRYDPFSDVSTAVKATERHLIPSVSPYVISLNEVPQKTSPSTMTVKQINSAGGAVAAFAEVAAIPEAGQFWADYNTNAAGSEYWNTGQLLFNASDAGKMIEVTYTATGTLASVTSNMYPAWYRDRGDGSNGDFWPTSDVTISGVKQYRSVYIPAGVTVYAGELLRICCQGLCCIGGTINANGKGAAGGVGHAGGDGICSAGGNGGSGMTTAGWAGGKALTDYRTELPYGAGGGGGGAYVYLAGADSGYDVGLNFGGTGGRGGGAVTITAGEIDFRGTITANATNGAKGSVRYSGGGVGGGGGGGGGSVTLIANRIKNTGTITVNGGGGGAGNGSGSSGGSAGGNGIIRIKELGVS